MRVIINADDLGLNAYVNEAIGEALSDGSITSSTILVNTDHWDEVLQIVNNHREASFGVHLNLTTGKPVTESSVFQDYGIIDTNGFFTKKIKSFDKIDKALLNAIYDEWDAQISLALHNGVAVSHLDGHHHVHTIFALRSILVSLLKKYAIKRCRNVYSHPFMFPKFRGEKKIPISSTASEPIKKEKNENMALKKICNIFYAKARNKWWKTQLIYNGITLTDYFDSYACFFERLLDGMNLPRNCSVELMCHPGSPLYEIETAFINRNELGRLRKDIQWVNYNNL